MKTIELDRDGDRFKATYSQGAQRAKVKYFDTRAEAEAFAASKMGARGCIISSLDATPEQLARIEARRAKAEAFWAAIDA